MRSAILPQYYLPETRAPQRRLSFVAKCLIERGPSVHALTAMPNYPAGAIFPGYRRWRLTEQTANEHILRSIAYRTKELTLPKGLLAAKVGST